MSSPGRGYTTAPTVGPKTLPVYCAKCGRQVDQVSWTWSFETGAAIVTALCHSTVTTVRISPDDLELARKSGIVVFAEKAAPEPRDLVDSVTARFRNLEIEDV